ncbi:MAG: Tfp pilus assembly protein PilF [Flavobacterium sp.]|jgi:Tfp pilus assembly protein PilF
MKDRYYNECSTTSVEALEFYVQAVHTLLIAQHGAIDLLQAAIVEDPGFGLAHATLAHTYSMMSRGVDAKNALKMAVACSVNANERERAHISIIAALINANATLAFDLAKQHLKIHPKDAIIAQAVSGAFGLIGFSGRVDREQENLAFMEQLASHYSGDAWFNSQYAFAISEAGDPDRARSIATYALELEPESADAIHTLAHIYYETDQAELGLEMLDKWRSQYHRDGILHGHIAWHCALWNLELGECKRAFQILETDIHPGVSHSPAINMVTDFVGFLIRAELMAYPVDSDHWSTASKAIKQLFPDLGLSFVDAHASIALAKNGELEELSRYSESHLGFANDQVASLAVAFEAYIEADWSSVINCLLPILSTHERLGGSRAQRDLLEAVNAHSLIRLNRSGEAISGKMQRRKRINNRIFGLL